MLQTVCIFSNWQWVKQALCFDIIFNLSLSCLPLATAGHARISTQRNYESSEGVAIFCNLIFHEGFNRVCGTTWLGKAAVRNYHFKSTVDNDKGKNFSLFFGLHFSCLSACPSFFSPFIFQSKENLSLWRLCLTAGKRQAWKRSIRFQR